MNATNLSVYNHSGGILHKMNIALELDYIIVYQLAQLCLPYDSLKLVRKCKQCFMRSIDDITLVRAGHTD